MRYQLIKEHLNHGAYVIGEFETLEEVEDAALKAEHYVRSDWLIHIYDTQG